MQRLPQEHLQALKQRYPQDAELQALLKAYGRAEKLLGRALWEFGSELRGEIEAFLGEAPLLR
jgi:hypothetical protein